MDALRNRDDQLNLTIDLSGLIKNENETLKLAIMVGLLSKKPINIEALLSVHWRH